MSIRSRLAAVAALALALAPAAATAQAPAPVGRVVFTVVGYDGKAPQRGYYGRGRIWIVGTDGTAATALTNGFDDEDATLSPDGHRIAFASDRGGPGTSNVYVMNLDGSQISALTHFTSPKEGVTSPSWSPDGSRLAVVHVRGARAALATVGADGTGLRDIVSGGGGRTNTAPSWSPDGAEIAFVRGTSRSRAVVSVRPDGTGLRHVAAGSGAQQVAGSVRWAPDGGRLVYDAGRLTGRTQVYVVARDGANDAQLTAIAHGGGAETPAFTADGGSIVYARTRSGAASQRHVAYKGGTLEVLDLTAKTTRTLFAVKRGRAFGATWLAG